MSSQIEQIAQRVGETFAACGACRVFELHRGAIQHFADHSLHDRFDRFSFFGREILEPAAYADVLSPEAVVLSHEGASGGLADRIVGRRQTTLLIGPEPGFSDVELDLARTSGVAVATFGPVVLRT